MPTNREKLAQLKSTSGNRPKIKEFPKPQGRDLDGWWVQIDEWRKALMLEVAQLVTEALPLPPVTQTPPSSGGTGGTGGGTTVGGAPFDASYVVLSLNDVLSKERALIGTVNQIDLDDLGPNNNVRLFLPQDIALTSTPTFDSLILQGPDADLTLGTSGTIADNAGVMSLFPITTVLIDSHTTINGMVRLDGDDNTHPALRSNVAVLEVRLADNSTYGDLRANELFLIQPLKSEYGGTGIAGTVPGALLFGSALNTYSLLSKDTNATRYLANTGTDNNPKWDFVNLTNGVTGELPLTNFPTISEYSVLGVAGGSAAQPAAIGPASNLQVLRRSGTTLGFGSIDISSGTVVTNVLRTVNGGTGLNTYTQGDLLYASTTGLGAVISLLAKDSTAAQSRYLSNTGGSNNPAWAQVNLADGVTGDLLYANLTPASAASLLFGRGSAAGGDWQEITLGAGLTMTGTVLSSSGGGSSPPFDDQATALVKGSTDVTKLLRFEVDGFTAATTRVLTPQNASYIIAGTNITNSFDVQQSFEGDAGLNIGSMLLTDPGSLGVLTIGGGNVEITGGKLVAHGDVIVYQEFLMVALSPAQITADQDDYDVGDASFIRLDSDASRTITGISQGSDGKHLILVNTGSFNITLANQSASSLAAHRFITGTGANITIGPDERVEATYDATTERWRFGAKVYSVGTHALLSATHTDTAAAGVSQGSIIVGNATPAWSELVIGAANRVLRSDGTNALWAQVNLTTDVTGTLPVANGGTGATAFTPGSVVFAGVAGVYTQDNANFFWDDTSNRLGIGTAVPGKLLHVAGDALVSSYLFGTTTAGAAKLSMNGLGGNGMDIIYGGGGMFRAAEFGIASSSDVFFQGVPVFGGYTYLEDWLGSGLIVGTGGAENPIILKPNRTERARLTNIGLGIGLTATAVLHMKAGAAAASSAPLKFTTGTNLTTAEAGAMEYATPDLFFTPGSAIRYNLPLVTGAGVQGDLLYASAASIYSRLAHPAEADKVLLSTETAITWGLLAISNTSGTLVASRGGTGISTYAQGDLLYASSPSPAFSALAKDTNATRYLSNTGTNNNPAWAQVNLANGVTGNLPVANLGSGTGAGVTTFWRGDGAWVAPLGVVMQVHGVNHATVTDSQTLYFGSKLVAASTTADNSRVYIPVTGTLRAAYLYINVAGTLGSAQTGSAYVRLNNTTDVTISTGVLWTAANQVFSASGLTQAVTAGDYFEIKLIYPAWSPTSPTNVTYQANLHIS